MADDVVVVGSHVTEFARISRLAVVEFAVDDDSDAQSPAYVHEDDIFQSFAASLDKLCVGHAAGIVLDAGWKLHQLCELLGQRILPGR